MLVKCVISLKRVSKERDPPLDSVGFIGKSVPLTPTFLGIFILRQYYSKKFSYLSAENRPVFPVVSGKKSQKLISLSPKGERV